MTSHRNIVDAVRTSLAGHEAVTAAWLFGSAAARADTPNDVDVAIWFGQTASGWEAVARVADALERALGRPVDAHSFDALPLDLQYRVLDEGILVKDADPRARTRRAARALLEYFDFAPYLARIRHGALSRLRDGGGDG